MTSSEGRATACSRSLRQRPRPVRLEARSASALQTKQHSSRCERRSPVRSLVLLILGAAVWLAPAPAAEAQGYPYGPPSGYGAPMGYSYPPVAPAMYPPTAAPPQAATAASAITSCQQMIAQA